MIAQMVLAELAGGITQIIKELGDCRCAGLQEARAAGLFI